jgi:hypothetical protein
MHGASAATPPLSSCPHENAPLRTDCGRVQQCAPPKCLLLQPALCSCVSVRGTVQLMVGPKVSRPAPRAPRMRIDFSYGIKRCIACMDPSIQGQPGPSVVSLHQTYSLSHTHTHARTPPPPPFHLSPLSHFSPPPPTAQVLDPISPLLDWATPPSAMAPPAASAAFTFARAPNSTTRPATACRHLGHSTACADAQDARLQYVCPQGGKRH